MQETTIDPHVRSALAPYFDATFYLAANPDVAASGIEPLTHFFVTGWREGRNPSNEFDCAFYLTTHNDVAQSGINPLLHYAYSGKTEGRRTARLLDYERNILERLEPPSLRAKHWEAAADNSDPKPVFELLRALRATKPKARAIAISHDDYLTSVGGVQNVMRDELAAFEASGWSYIHLAPAAPLPTLATPGAPNLFPVKVRIGREMFGIVTASTLAAACAELGDQGENNVIIIHHLMGFNVEAVSLIVEGATDTPPYFWTHDYFARCPSYTLMRNDLSFCGAPPPESPACTVCAYGEERQLHLRRINAFFERFTPALVAPSEVALAQWTNSTQLPVSSSHVTPLAHLSLTQSRKLSKSPSEPFRVAYLGARVRHKGWRSFESLATRFCHDARYQFFQFGIDHGARAPKGIRHVEVQVSEQQPNAMIDALKAHQIDAAFILPEWPETFNFTVHEALAAGLFVITGPNTGNVWPAVLHNAPAQGKSFESSQQIHETFADGSIINAVAQNPMLSGNLRRADGTHTLVQNRHHAILAKSTNGAAI